MEWASKSYQFWWHYSFFNLILSFEFQKTNRFVLKSDNSLSGGRVVGVLKYTMLVDGDDLEIPIKDFYINDYFQSRNILEIFNR